MFCAIYKMRKVVKMRGTYMCSITSAVKCTAVNGPIFVRPALMHYVNCKDQNLCHTCCSQANTTLTSQPRHSHFPIVVQIINLRKDHCTIFNLRTMYDGGYFIGQCQLNFDCLDWDKFCAHQGMLLPSTCHVPHWAVLWATHKHIPKVGQSEGRNPGLPAIVKATSQC